MSAEFDAKNIRHYASSGNLKALQWIHKYKHHLWYLEKVMDEAAMNGHLDVVQWLHENRSEGITTSAMDRAVINGHLDVVQFLHKKGGVCTTWAMNQATRKGYLDVVHWLDDHLEVKINI